MPDRLAELHRQRTLAQQQLAWFDREIAAIEGTVGAKPMRAESKADTPVPLAATPEAVAGPAFDRAVPAPATGDDLIERYRVPPDTLRKDVRKGCMLYFALSLLLLGVSVTVLYFTLRSR